MSNANVKFICQMQMSNANVKYPCRQMLMSNAHVKRSCQVQMSNACQLPMHANSSQLSDANANKYQTRLFLVQYVFYFQNQTTNKTKQNRWVTQLIIASSSNIGVTIAGPELIAAIFQEAMAEIIDDVTYDYPERALPTLLFMMWLTTLGYAISWLLLGYVCMELLFFLFLFRFLFFVFVLFWFWFCVFVFYAGPACCSCPRCLCFRNSKFKIQTPNHDAHSICLCLRNSKSKMQTNMPPLFLFFFLPLLLKLKMQTNTLRPFYDRYLDGSRVVDYLPVCIVYGFLGAIAYKVCTTVVAETIGIHCHFWYSE